MRFLFILTLSIPLFLFGQSTDIEAKCNELFSKKAFDYSTHSLSVRSIDDDREIVGIRSDSKLSPASSLKLITNFIALQVLGEDYTFTTKIGYAGTIDDSGTLEGDIVVIGSGDPSFASLRSGKDLSIVLDKIKNAVDKAGIKCIDGNISVRTNVFSGQAASGAWPYGDLANYYGSGAYALNFNDNEYNLYFKGSSREGQIAQVDHTAPYIPSLAVASEVVVKGPKSGDQAYIYGDQTNYAKIVRGSIPLTSKQFKIRGSIPNPPLTFAALLAKHLNLKVQGINVNADPIKKSEFQQIATLKSKPLNQLVKDANLESLNLYCEAFLRLCAKKETGTGSLENGLDIIEQYLVKIGIDKRSFSLDDGSGLSPRNLITTSSFTQFLAHIAQSQKKYTSYIPQVSKEGTVTHFMTKQKGNTRFHLKSGSMGGVLSYTGAFTASSGKQYAISFIANNHSDGNYAIKVQIEKLFEVLYLNL